MKRVALAFWGLFVVAPSLVHARQSSAQKPEDAAAARKEGQEPAGKDWPTYTGNDAAWQYSSLDQINTTNVKKLVPAWIFQTGDYAESLQATPIIVDGVLYITTAKSYVFAIDGATGKLIWQYKYEPVPGTTGSGQSRGVAVAQGMVFEATFDDNLVALDQKTGKEVWKVAIDDPTSCGCRITDAPLVTKDKVVIGNGGESRRGYVAAFNIKTGRQEWRFYTVPGPGEVGSDTWGKGDQRQFGAAAAWVTGSYDPELNLIYWGTGNPGDMSFGADREGSNLYSCSILAIDADTGKLKWYFQQVPHDTWDYDSSYTPMLIDREIDGKMRKLMVAFNKNGFFNVLDRQTGEVLGTHRVADNINWVGEVTQKGELIGRKDVVGIDQPHDICPSALGIVNRNHTAYSPRTGLIYLPAMELCSTWTARAAIPGATGAASRGRADYTMDWVKIPGHDKPYSHIDAIDPITGKKVWSDPYEYQLLASMLATGGDLVFTGDPEGNFFAMDARTGEKLWSFQTGAGHRGTAVAYMAGGKQYIATPTGWGSIAARLVDLEYPESDEWRLGSTLVVFALPEDSQ